MIVLRGRFGAAREGVTGQWRELHSEGLNDRYCYWVTGQRRELHNEGPNDRYCLLDIVRVIKSRIMRWAEHAARIGERRSVYTVLVGKPEGRRPLGRPRRRWEYNIKMDFQDVGVGI